MTLPYSENKKLLSSQTKLSRGFTLIEILIVTGIIGVLTSLSIAAYSVYTRNQKFTNTVNDVYNMLQVAKSRASSQYAPSEHCTYDPIDGYRFDGYRVTIDSSDPTNGRVIMSVLCDGAKPMTVINTGAVTVTSTESEITFKSLEGTVDTPSNIEITITSGNSKTITIQPNGKITISN